MSLTIAARNINTVAIFDDKHQGRESMMEMVHDANLNPISQDGKLGKLDEFISALIGSADAAIFDQHLKPGNYADFNGAEAVSMLYSRGFPALLVTALADMDFNLIRPFRKNIPVLIESTDVAPEKILGGFEQCIKEFSAEYTKERKTTRTLVRIEDIEPSIQVPLIYIAIPAWDPDKVVKLPMAIFPKNLLKQIIPGNRFYAEVNIGAERHDELFFENFVVAKPLSDEYAKLLRT